MVEEIKKKRLSKYSIVTIFFLCVLHSWDEMARYDLPAMIDYVSSRTGQGQISYVGYSQGTTVGFAALSQTPHLATKLKQFIALAPVGRVGNVTSVIRLVVPHIAKIQVGWRVSLLFHTFNRGRGSSVGRARDSWSGGPGFDPRCGRPLLTVWVGVSIM